MKKINSLSKKTLLIFTLLSFFVASNAFSRESATILEKDIEEEVKEHIEKSIQSTPSINEDEDDDKIIILSTPTNEPTDEATDTSMDESLDDDSFNKTTLRATDDEVTIEELSEDEGDEESDNQVKSVDKAKNNNSDDSTTIDISNLTNDEIRALGHKLRVISSQEEKKDIINALKKLKDKAAPSTNEVLASIHEKKVSTDAIDILINIGTPTAISGLARLVSNSDINLSNYILQSLVKLKSKAEPIVPEIYANFQNKELKENIINALGEIKGDIAFYELKELLKSKTETQEILILSLKNFMKFDNAKKELPLLRRLFRQNSPSEYANELSRVIFELEDHEQPLKE